MNLYTDYSLKELNTFNIEAKAKYYVEVFSRQDIEEVLNDNKYKNLPLLVLGGGSNILLTGDFNGLVIKNSLKGIQLLSKDKDEIIVRAEAGEIWDDLVNYCVKKGYAGLENLTLIPGTVGASPIQNIGAYGVEIKDSFLSLEGIDTVTGEVRTFITEECRFGYRDSIFKHEMRGRFIITSVTFKLKDYTNPNFCYEGLRRKFENVKGTITIQQVRDAVKEIRTAKLPDTQVLGNAGSFFKNPEIDLQHYSELKKEYTDIPGYPLADGKIKVPAGYLIEKAGFKGLRRGCAGVYEKQALVLVNYGGADGSEVLELAHSIQDKIKNMFKIEIHIEVNII